MPTSVNQIARAGAAGCGSICLIIFGGFLSFIGAVLCGIGYNQAFDDPFYGTSPLRVAGPIVLTIGLVMLIIAVGLCVYVCKATAESTPGQQGRTLAKPAGAVVVSTYPTPAQGYPVGQQPPPQGYQPVPQQLHGYQAQPQGYQPPPQGYQPPPQGYPPAPQGYQQPPQGYQQPPQGYQQQPLQGYQPPPQGYQPTPPVNPASYQSTSPAYPPMQMEPSAPPAPELPSYTEAVAEKQ